MNNMIVFASLFKRQQQTCEIVLMEISDATFDFIVIHNNPNYTSLYCVGDVMKGEMYNGQFRKCLFYSFR